MLSYKTKAYNAMTQGSSSSYTNCPEVIIKMAVTVKVVTQSEGPVTSVYCRLGEQQQERPARPPQNCSVSASFLFYFSQ